MTSRTAAGRARLMLLWKFTVENALLLIAGTLTALVWANVSYVTYEPFAHALHFAVNDIGMVFFFALATKEIVEATLPGGALASPREAGVPVLAAVGGMAAPAALYILQANLLGRPDLVNGWAIPCATEWTAFASGRVNSMSGPPTGFGASRERRRNTGKRRAMRCGPTARCSISAASSRCWWRAWVLPWERRWPR